MIPMRQSRDERHITDEHDQASLWPAAAAREVTTSRGKRLLFAAFDGVIFSSAQTAGLHPAQGWHTRDPVHGYKPPHRRAPEHRAARWSRLVR